MQETGSTEDVPACFSFGIVLFINAAIWRNNTMEFFNQAITVLQTLVVAIGAGLGVWGVVNLMEGYGNDNPGANTYRSQGYLQSCHEIPGISQHPFRSGQILNPYAHRYSEPFAFYSISYPLHRFSLLRGRYLY